MGYVGRMDKRGIARHAGDRAQVSGSAHRNGGFKSVH